jgi:hypothetical protein
MLKTAATYATFLLVISVLYYVPFWWAFDVDVLSFFETKDLLLGVIFPLRYNGAYFLAILLFFSIITAFIRPQRFRVPSPNLDKVNKILSDLEEDEKEEVLLTKDGLKREALALKTEIEGGRKLDKFEIITTLIYIVWVGFSIYALIVEPYSRFNSVTTAFAVVQLIFQVIEVSYGLPYNLLELSDSNIRWAGILDFFLIQFLLFMPISAVTSSYSESQAILQGKRFRYIMASDLDSIGLQRSQDYAVYLGVINDKFILTDSINSTCIVLDKDKIPVLHVHSYDYKDTISIARFDKLVAEAKESKKRPAAADSIAIKKVKVSNSK